MRKKTLTTLFIMAAYWAWARSGREVRDPPTGLNLEDVTEYGNNCGCGNIVGVQPYMLPIDYASEARFYAKLNGYLGMAQKRAWLNEKTIVVFPEHIGTWLVGLGEKAYLYRAPTITRALAVFVLSNPIGVLRWALGVTDKNPLASGVFRMKGEWMAAAYHRAFSALARAYGVTIVAGSIVLPNPIIRDGRLHAGKGPLYNASLVYRPDGVPCPHIVRKAYPVPAELRFVSRWRAADLPAFEVPAGRLGVLICADAWYPQPYARLEAQGVEIVVVPSYLLGDGTWDHPWRGYSYEPPPDVDPSDVGRITEGAAWLRYAMAARLPRTHIRYGMNVFLRGRLWNLGADGHTTIVADGQLIQARHVSGATLANLWLSRE